MGKGSSAAAVLRCFAAPLLALWTAAATLHPAPEASWWELRFLMTVRGEYTFTERGAQVTGRYACTARWQGTMERDGPDFLLSCLRSEIERWDIEEGPAAPSAPGDLAGKAGPAKPRLGLYYVLSEGDAVRFAFEIDGVAVPLGPSAEKHILVLPCAGERVSRENGYDGSIVRGDNRILIPRTDLDRGTVERTFSWEWKRRRLTSRDGGTICLTNTHHADVLVTLVPGER
jgi:hypothetical protein